MQFFFDIYLGWKYIFIFTLPDWLSIVFGIDDGSIFYGQGERVLEGEERDQARKRHFWEFLGRG
jgi:hypothetical protein